LFWALLCELDRGALARAARFHRDRWQDGAPHAYFRAAPAAELVTKTTVEEGHGRPAANAGL
jgi:hypothetical protein